MDAIISFFTGVFDAFLGFFNGLYDPNEGFVIPLIICVVFAALMSGGAPPKRWDVPWLTWILSGFAASFLILLFRGGMTDAVLIGFLVMLVGFVTLTAQRLGNKHDRSIGVGILYGVVSIVLLSTIFGIVVVNQQEGMLAPAIADIKEMADRYIASMQRPQ
jgi:tetrahydromethanopterin S-methyltransferase subunit G